MKAGIVGASGYSGLELIRILLNHPNITIDTIVSPSNAEVKVEEIFPHLTDIVTIQFDSLDCQMLANRVDVVFFATPAGVSSESIPTLIDLGVLCIDLSGDFRLKGEGLYEEWYKHASPPMKTLEKAVYGLPEFYREEISTATLIANPGCYPTATLLGILPIIKQKWADPTTLIVDGKSGLSGAGRKMSQVTHYTEANENMSAYKLGKHQHIPEIEEVLRDQIDKDVQVSFSTHLIPLTRGMMCTMVIDLTEDKTSFEIIDYYRSFYKDHPFIRIMPEGKWPNTKGVSGSNYCDIGISVDSRTTRLTVISVIDNLMKGAAGQAVQNMNLRFGLQERTGLELSPIFP
ncbi:N-acetyl-gamma-glutamyl-phosphate reductase [Guptibacillus algicola]|uniref:N-acetyl-gamma-glutamyl-phosphate reductase n=1 Tax=Guptibacillus algicola TaxID=225844 RepID=UPI001CD3ED5A|nr:N-acetyl-gamma-glutamyl-phosphate reductase [Alkalihalobacillus algicola]MCA0988262.1 N-acetyl-gamma-glutamyl-phosphate reductase [Alkalihalobacillus algicola]